MFELGWQTEESHYHQKGIYFAEVHDFKQLLWENISLLLLVVRLAEIQLGFATEHPPTPAAPPRFNLNVIQFNF